MNTRVRRPGGIIREIVDSPFALLHPYLMRCPRCESSDADDFFQNTVRQSRNVGGGDVLEGGLGSFEFDTKLWTCKKCMVRCVSEQEFADQKWQAELMKMGSEERKKAVLDKVEAQKRESLEKFVAENGREPYPDWVVVPIALIVFGLIGYAIWYTINI